jgi:hypothetical protein
LLLFLFLRLKVLSFTTFCFLASSAFDGPTFFGDILSRGSDYLCREARIGPGMGGGRRRKRRCGGGRRGKRRHGGEERRVSWVWGFMGGRGKRRRGGSF